MSSALDRLTHIYRLYATDFYRLQAERARQAAEQEALERDRALVALSLHLEAEEAKVDQALRDAYAPVDPRVPERAPTVAEVDDLLESFFS